ncbi:kelch domain containing 4 [Halocaridina rubra]|uniref:Kelch domain containing 4 n=1 Tax=Halocaridina rubra TaxID=373956 RepID=A0AAN9A0Q8_HALRR
MERKNNDGGEDISSFSPPPRINAGMVVKHNVLHLYGGMYEDGDKQLTLNDFYSLDLNKLEDWTVIIPLDPGDLEWFDSESEEGDESDDDDDESDEDDDDENKEEDKESMDVE